MASAFRSTALRQASAATFRTPLPTFRQPFALQRAAFQTTAKKQILPALPQVLRGTINDAAKVPDPEPTHGSYHWTFERILSVGLVPITIAPFAAGSLSPLLDGAFIGMILIHSYIGFGSIITDYLPKWRVPFWRKLFEWANVLAVFVVGWGWYEFETNDVGLTEGVRRIWRAKRE